MADAIEAYNLEISGNESTTAVDTEYRPTAGTKIYCKKYDGTAYNFVYRTGSPCGPYTQITKFEYEHLEDKKSDSETKGSPEQTSADKGESGGTNTI